MVLELSAVSGKPALRIVEQSADAGLAAFHYHPVEILGVRCPQHGRLLTEVAQNDVYPYANRRTCSVVDGGVPCNRHVGLMYCCNAPYWAVPVEHTLHYPPILHLCNYALCERHWCPTVSQNALSRIVGTCRLFVSHGADYVISHLVVFLVTVLYTPLLATVLMILSCHPYFQCTFGRCWKALTADYVISAYSSIAIAVTFGLGVPIFAWILLLRRKVYINRCFSESDRRYTEEDGSPKLVQWCRYLTSDDSAMSALYNHVLPLRLAFFPSFLIFKLGLLLPVILLSPNTPEQLIVVAAMELAFALFTVLSSPYLSPWLDVLSRLGCAHQLILLALQSWYSIEKLEGTASVIHHCGSWMIVTSAIYLGFVLCFALGIALKPLLYTHLQQRRRRQVLEKHGLSIAPTLPYFVSGIDGTHVTQAKPLVRDEEVVDDEDGKMMKRVALMTFRLRSGMHESGKSYTDDPGEANDFWKGTALWSTLEQEEEKEEQEEGEEQDEEEEVCDIETVELKE